MKNVTSLTVFCTLLALLLAVPALSQQVNSPEPATVDVTKDWKFDQESLDLLQSAMQQQRDVDTSATHLINSDLAANMISRIWRFTWKNQHLRVTEFSSFTAAAREDVQLTIESLSYTVSEDDGRIICMWSSNCASGKTTVALVKPLDKGVVAEVFRPETGKSRTVFATLEAPYYEAFHGVDLPLLRVGQKDVTVGYNEDSNSLCKYEYSIVAANPKPSGNPPWTVNLEAKVGNGNHYVAFIDEKNHMARLEMNGMEFVQCDPAVAIKERNAPLKTISLLTPIDCWVLDGKHKTSLSMRLETKNPVGSFLTQNARQSVTSVPGKPNQTRVRTRPERAPSAGELANTKLPAGAEIREALKPSVDIESDSPEIIKCARDIVGPEKRPWQQGLLLAKWISKYIKATYDIANGTALETLRSRRGDCTEDAGLLVAFARSLHIPARKASGWKVIADSLCGHAWAEIYVGNRWIELDPTTAAMADATYIKRKQDQVVILDRAYIDEMQSGQTMTKVDKNRPYWVFRSQKYYNRALGLTMTLPSDAFFGVTVRGLDIPLPLTEGESPVGSVPPLLFVLKPNSPAQPASQNPDPESVAVCITDKADSVDNVASGGVFFGSRMGDHVVFQHGHRTVTAFRVTSKDGASGVIYEVELNSSMCINFYCQSADTGSALPHSLPPLVASILDTIKLTKPDIGPSTTLTRD